MHWHTQALLDRLICYINRGVVPIMQKKKKTFFKKATQSCTVILIQNLKKITVHTVDTSVSMYSSAALILLRL